MPLRTLLRFLANDQVVERLADSYPIRRMAQITHFMYRRLTLWGNDALDKAVKSNEAKENPQVSGRLVSFTRNFVRNLQNEIEKNQHGPR
ncbi:hypothetical protein ACROYT_G025985 [Oculina patagonica]